MEGIDRISKFSGLIRNKYPMIKMENNWQDHVELENVKSTYFSNYPRYGTHFDETNYIYILKKNHNEFDYF